MITLLSDHDIELYARLLWSEFSPGDWQDFGVGGLAAFADVGLNLQSTDRAVWLYCQANDALLLTGNRNMEDDDSLEAVIRELNQADSLPVLTMSNPRRLVKSDYRETCAYRVAQIAEELESFRGSARIFVP